MKKHQVLWIGFGLGVVIGVLLFFIESPVDGWVRENVRGPLRRSAHFIGKYGDWPQLMLLGAVLWLIFKWLKKTEWRRIVLTMMICSTVSGLVVNASRLTTGRTRPSAKMEQGWYGPRHEGEWLVGRHQANSFPSGHTATAFGFFAPLVFMRPWIGVPMLVVPTLIALARIGSRSHHPSDVWWAMWVSFLCAWWISSVVGRRFRDNSARSPDASPD